MEIEDPAEVELLESFHREIIVVIKQLEDNESSRFNHATTKLLNAATDEILHLKVNFSSLTYCSFHTRNILEIYLILHHIKNDCNALEKWDGQLSKDVEDLKDKIMPLCEREGIDTSNLENLQKHQNELMEKISLDSSRGFPIGELAKKCELFPEYLIANKLTSKFIHPTAMRVMGCDSSAVKLRYLRMVTRFGLLFSQKIKEFAQNHIEASNHPR